MNNILPVKQTNMGVPYQFPLENQGVCGGGGGYTLSSMYILREHELNLHSGQSLIHIYIVVHDLSMESTICAINVHISL